MKYRLELGYLECEEQHPITQGEFEKLRSARELLSGAFDFEQTWEIVVFNHLELERQQLAYLTEHLVRSMRGYDDMHALTAPFAPRLANLLTSTRLYLDQIPQLLSSELKEAFTKLCRRHHSESFEYRFMYELRNHMQHCSVPIHEFSPGNGRGEYSVRVMTHKHRLADGAKFKASILKEMPDSVELLSASRVYVERLSSIHVALRELQRKGIDSARTLLEQSHEVFKRAIGSSGDALRAVI